jgi:hypothetical protein
MRKSVWIALALSVGSCAAPGFSDSDVASFEQLLRNNDSVPLAVALARAPKSPQLIAWMRQKAEEGHPIVQYALARELVSTDDKPEALKWAAIGRMNYALDSKECARKSFDVSALLELGYQQLQKVADSNELLWAEGIEAAIHVEETRTTRVPPYWVCDPGNPNASEASLLPPDERARQRKRQFDYLVSRGYVRAMEARLNANLNPDRYAIYGPNPGLHDNKWDRDSSMVWVDENKLIFGGFINPKEPDNAPRSLYIWSLPSNETKVLAQDGYGICKSAPDFYSFFERRDGKRYLREGRLDALSEREFNAATSFTRYLCRIYADNKSPYRQLTRELEHGEKIKNVVGPNGADQAVEFWPAGSEGFVKLPFTWREIRGGYPHYAAYPGAYLFQGSSLRWDAPSTSRVWLVWPDGRAEMIQMPRGPWGESQPTYLPTKAGWLVQLANHGLYLVKGQQVTKLVNADPKGTIVSPDGCRIASRFHRRGGNLWVIDLCKRN